ncbi:MAG TPA: UDP-3-O-acyl-N-acetylglucosamine deacetylase [Candidatus Nanoarchaeia archaeon]|nr:UDP-3-O-acyl-N-acetylglucosamine deacetylase [Candidatus Nanoarchaeia archaeon]
MEKQRTLKDDIEILGIEPYGGNRVSLKISPASENRGIIFYNAAHGAVRANLAAAQAYKSSITLRNDTMSVLNVEHILATLYSYGIDNAMIQVARQPNKSFAFLEYLHLATAMQVLPYFTEREKTLCERIDEVGVEAQQMPRRMLRLKEDIITDKLSLEKTDTPGLIVRATTSYPLLGESTIELQITPEAYKSELSRARPYAKHAPAWMPRKITRFFACLLNPSFGLSHGFDEDNVLVPERSREKLLEEQRRVGYDKGDEITRHTIVDRLGSLALLPGRLDHVRVTARFSGHANDLDVLRKNLDKLSTSSTGFSS